MIIKAISLWQIWALAMERELKRNETRSWSTDYRGWLAIHAAKKPFYARDYSVEFVTRVRRDGLLDAPLTYGAVLCVVRLVDVLRVEQVRNRLSETERVYGNYDDGRYAWVTKDRVAIPEPIPLTGHQGLFDWDVPSWLAVKLGATSKEVQRSQRSLFGQVD